MPVSRKEVPQGEGVVPFELPQQPPLTPPASRKQQYGRMRNFQCRNNCQRLAELNVEGSSVQQRGDQKEDVGVGQREELRPEGDGIDLVK